MPTYVIEIPQWFPVKVKMFLEKDHINQIIKQKKEK